MKPQTTLGMAASSSMTIFSVSFSLRAAKLGDENRRAETERHRHDHGQHGHAERADQQREDAVAHIGHGGRIPFRAEKKLAELEVLALEDRRASRKMKKKIATTKMTALTPLNG